MYFPTSRYLARKNEISNFKQQEGEVPYYFRERLKLLLSRCPSHKMSKLDIMQAFMMGLKPDIQMLLDASVGGTMKIKTTDELQELIDNMSLNEY